MATDDDDNRSDEGGSRLWRGMRTLIFGEDHEATLRDKLEDAIDEADAAAPKRGDLSPLERQMLRNLLHFGDRTAGEIAVTRGDIVAVPANIAFDDHPNDKRFSDRIETVTVDSVFAWLQRSGLGGATTTVR